jgi:hypothetical protein
MTSRLTFLSIPEPGLLDQLSPEVKEQLIPLSKGFVPYEIELGYDHWNACTYLLAYLQHLVVDRDSSLILILIIFI